MNPVQPINLSRRLALAAGVAFLLALPGALPGSPVPDVSSFAADVSLISAVSQKATDVLRLFASATNTMDLSSRISVKPAPVESPNTNDVVSITPPSPPEPTFELRGLSPHTGKPFALINGRWFGVGEAVAADGTRVVKIASDHVVLVNTQGVQRVVPFYRNHR